MAKRFERMGWHYSKGKLAGVYCPNGPTHILIPCPSPPGEEEKGEKQKLPKR